MSFLDRLLKAAIPHGVFLTADERMKLAAAGELPVLFSSDVTFAMPDGLRDFRYSRAGSDGIAATAASLGKPIAYLEITVDLRKRGAFVFYRRLGHGLADGTDEGTRTYYCVAERREGWLRRRTVFLYWTEPAGGYYHPPLVP